jgi:arylsulfatase A-like enzyme
MVDQMKATSSHLYGGETCETPSLERLAERGTLFDLAFTPQPLCVPARSSLWTARYPHSHGSRRNELLLGPDVETAWQTWRAAGLRTALIGKNHCFDEAALERAFDAWCEIGHVGLGEGRVSHGMTWCRTREEIEAAHRLRREMPQVSPRFSYAVSDVPEEWFATAMIAEQTETFLRDQGASPFALWVSFPDPHEPYVVPRRYAEMFPPDSIDLPPSRDGEFDRAPVRTQVLHRMMGFEADREEDVRATIGVYHAMVRFVDDALGRILDALDATGLAERTIVVFVSDHGDFAGEHRMFVKGGAFYDCLTRVPMIVSWPGRLPEGAVDRSLVNLVDVAPTLLQLQGLCPLGLQQGQPLPTVTPAAPRAAAFSEYGAGGPPFTHADLDALAPLEGYAAVLASLQQREAEGRRKMVRTERWKYVHDPSGDVDELYDLEADPWELCNLGAAPELEEIRRELQRLLLEWSVRTEDGRPVPLP